MLKVIERLDIVQADHLTLNETIRLCHKYALESCIEPLLTRIRDNLQPDKLMYLNLLRALARHEDGRSIDLTVPPYASFAKAIIVAAMESLQPRPEAFAWIHAARSIGCNKEADCSACDKVRVFFKSDQPALHLKSIGAPHAKHAERQLDRYCNPSLADWGTDSRTPRGFSVSSRAFLPCMIAQRISLGDQETRRWGLHMGKKAGPFIETVERTGPT